MMLYLLKNPAEWVVSDDLVEKIGISKLYVLDSLDSLEALDLVKQTDKTEKKEEGGWSSMETWRIKQDLDKDFASLLKEELEIKLQNMEI